MINPCSPSCLNVWERAAIVTENTERRTEPEQHICMQNWKVQFVRRNNSWIKSIVFPGLCRWATGVVYIPVAFDCERPCRDEAVFFPLPADVISLQTTNRVCFLLIVARQLPSVRAITHRQKLSLTAPLSSRQSHPRHSHYVSWLSSAADITFPQLPVRCVTVLWKHRVAANQQCAEMWCPSSSMRENPQYELSALHLHFRTVYSSCGIWSRSSFYLLHPGKKMYVQLEKHLKMKRLEISRRAGGEENSSAVFSEYDKNNK